MTTQTKLLSKADAGAMSPDQVTRVRADFDLIRPRARAVGVELYSRLFELDPPTRRLFSREIAEHADNLMAAFGMVVASLDDLPAIASRVAALARRHASYGVTPTHIVEGGVALIETLEADFGPAFTPDAREAWSAAYGALAALMIEAMSTP